MREPDKNSIFCVCFHLLGQGSPFSRGRSRILALQSSGSPSHLCQTETLVLRSIL